jgi:dTDP-4-dehydrorhamnose reductase
MKTILVTGSKGRLGSALVRELLKIPYTDLVQTDRNELDITDYDAVKSAVASVKPALVINCAAYTAVDSCETDRSNAFKANAEGPRNIAEAAYLQGAAVMHFSTDYVFGGEGIRDENGIVRPYTELDEPNPQTVYGQSKLVGERHVMTVNPRHYVIRTAWLYGNGESFVTKILRAAKGRDSIRVVADQWGTPTSISELVRVSVRLMDTDNYGLFHGTCEGSCTWWDFAVEIFRMLAIKIDVAPVSYDDFPRPAKRPRYSVLDNYMLRCVTDIEFADWKDALSRTLHQL